MLAMSLSAPRSHAIPENTIMHRYFFRKQGSSWPEEPWRDSSIVPCDERTMISLDAKLIFFLRNNDAL